MAQTVANQNADQGAESDRFAVSEFTRWATLAERLCQEGVQQEIAADLAAGRPVYYGGVGDEAGKVLNTFPWSLAVG
jgi:hypothetical protein